MHSIFQEYILLEYHPKQIEKQNINICKLFVVLKVLENYFRNKNITIYCLDNLDLSKINLCDYSIRASLIHFYGISYLKK